MRAGGTGRIALIVTAALAALAWVGAAPAAADTLVVTKRSDPAPGACTAGDCSLREAVRAANARAGADKVVLPARGPYGLSQSNTAPPAGDDTARRGDLDVSDRLTMIHPGKGRATIDARGIDRPMHVLPGAATKLVRLKLVNGDSPTAPEASGRARRGPFGDVGDGGGLLAEAPVRLIRCAVSRNTGARQAGGIASYGFPLTLLRSSVSGNESIFGVSGGIDGFNAPVRIVRSRIAGNKAANAGGGVTVSTDGTLTLKQSTVTGNEADSNVGGVYLYEAEGRIVGSTVSGNRAGGSGGGISATSSTLTVANSTVANNEAMGGGGGIENSIAGSNITLRSVTVVRNLADSGDTGSGDGGGLFRDGGTFEVVNSLIALNREGTQPSDVFGPVTSLGGNLLTTDAESSGFNIGSGDYLRPAPKLGPLARNGGPTQTVALRRGSPAIGRAREDEAPARDQRGNRRDGRPDIGAFER